MTHLLSIVGLLVAALLTPAVAEASRPVVADTTTADSARTPISVDERPAEREICPVGCTPVPNRVDYSPLPPQATLSYWAQSRRLMILDREHSVGNRFFDRGVFRHVTPFTDREYELDLMAYRFSPFENAQWTRASGGLRMRAGSVERDLWAIKTEIKNTVALGDSARHYFTIDGIIQEDPQVQRSWLQMSYAYRLAPHHAVGLRHTFSQYKYDLDVTPYYAYASPKWGQASVGLTFLNAYSNFIYERLGINEEVLDIVRVYETKPLLLELSYSSPTTYALRGEFHAGLQPKTRSLYFSQTADSYRFRDAETAHYLGALLEYRLDPVTVGVYVQQDGSSLARETAGDSLDTSYRTEQTQRRVGAYVRTSWRKFRLEANAFTGFYDDIQSGDNFEMSTLDEAFAFTTETNGVHSRLVYEPEGLPFFGVEYLTFLRRLPANARALVPWSGKYWDIGPDNYRLVGLIGYRFGRGSVAMGIGYDTDGDFNADKPAPLKRFDNGFFRFAMTW
ncbi:hypothetical protein CRI94_14975 [Longibacter salinarum]|uniref:Haemolysin activator HlyB C-terminal domain-containing protein n=1 Tax=Longibacter salinarum TaxID=1850348 RepID=A0A2A8CUS5_9BACT|nr:hypothetical protein [Longibacter salinarum]PEN12322.1 hypothetical protein CRI94_14975 [Longibacter salinarum]